MTEEQRGFRTFPAADGWDVLSLEINAEATGLTGPYREPLIAWMVAEPDQAADELGVMVGQAVPVTPAMQARRVWIFGLQQRVNIGQGIVRIWSRKLRGVDVDEAHFLERAWSQLNEEWEEVYGETLEETLRRARAEGDADAPLLKEPTPA